MENVSTNPAPKVFSDLEIEEKIIHIIIETLGREPGTVSTKTILTEELGAESLDFLDIVFKVEKAFKIQITRGEMERAARGDMSDDDFAPAGIISDIGLQRLKELIPESAHRIQPGLRPGQILTLFTVGTFVNMVKGKLANQTI